MRTAEPQHSLPDKDIKKRRNIHQLLSWTYDHLIDTKRIFDIIYQ